MTKPKEFSFTLLVAHTHNGTKYRQGDTITVNAADAAWLAHQKIIKPLKAE